MLEYSSSGDNFIIVKKQFLCGRGGEGGREEGGRGVEGVIPEWGEVESGKTIGMLQPTTSCSHVRRRDPVAEPSRRRGKRSTTPPSSPYRLAG